MKDVSLNFSPIPWSIDAAAKFLQPARSLFDGGIERVSCIGKRNHRILCGIDPFTAIWFGHRQSCRTIRGLCAKQLSSKWIERNYDIFFGTKSLRWWWTNRVHLSRNFLLEESSALIFLGIPFCFRNLRGFVHQQCNSRPVSLLPVASEVCERVAVNQLATYMNNNRRLTERQSGSKLHTWNTKRYDDGQGTRSSGREEIDPCGPTGFVKSL